MRRSNLSIRSREKSEIMSLETQKTYDAFISSIPYHLSPSIHHCCRSLSFRCTLPAGQAGAECGASRERRLFPVARHTSYASLPRRNRRTGLDAWNASARQDQVSASRPTPVLRRSHQCSAAGPITLWNGSAIFS